MIYHHKYDLFSAEQKSLESSTKALNQNFSELEARRVRRQNRKTEPKQRLAAPEVNEQPVIIQQAPVQRTNSRIMSSSEKRPSSSKSSRSVRKSSFGVSATPSVRTSETQTEQQQVKSVRRYASMNDIRKSRKPVESIAINTSLTESEV